MSAGFHSLKVVELRQETPDAVSIRFDLPEELADTFSFQPGQHLTLRREIGGEEVRRNYSLCVSPLDGELRVAVKRTTGGVFSNWANGELRTGDMLEVMPPHGTFSYEFDENEARSYVGFAGGSGITPILSLLKTALLSEPKSRFTLLYANRNSLSIMFLEQLAALKDRFLDRLQIFHFLEEEEEEIELFNGRIDAQKCDTIFSRLIDPAGIDAFFICGPGPMMETIEGVLEGRGVARERILIERFTVGAQSAAEAKAAEALVARAAQRKFTVELDGRRRQVSFDAKAGSILESARAAGLSAPFACKGGVCATCRAKIISGSAEMKTNYALTPEEVARGYILTCQAAPTSDDLVISYDA